MESGKKIAVIGLGKEGTATANFLAAQNDVTVFEEKEEGEANHEFLKKLDKKIKVVFNSPTSPLNFDIVIRSPGVQLDNQLLQKIIATGAVKKTPTQIFFEQCPCPVIGITGTKGKGTTSTLIYEILKEAGKDVYLAGNIGIPALEILPKLSEKSIAVLELSSFQLIDLEKSPHIAVVLMTTSEHLNWHKDIKEYVSAKQNIVNFQTENDFAVVNHDYENCLKIAQSAKSKVYFFSTKTNTNGLYLEGELIVSEIGKKEELGKTTDVFIPGRHNLQNVLAAVTVAKILNISNSTISNVLKNFKGLKHRLQFVAKKSGVSFYNDSFSTTPETAIAALDAFTGPKVIILGGSSKKSDFSQLAKKIVTDKKLKAVILIGEEGQTIKNAMERAGSFKDKIIQGAKNMPEIVHLARQNSQSGDVVILSPACASFDMFKNYEDRGDRFTQEVKKLK